MDDFSKTSTRVKTVIFYLRAKKVNYLAFLFVASLSGCAGSIGEQSNSANSELPNIGTIKYYLGGVFVSLQTQRSGVLSLYRDGYTTQDVRVLEAGSYFLPQDSFTNTKCISVTFISDGKRYFLTENGASRSEQCAKNPKNLRYVELEKEIELRKSDRFRDDVNDEENLQREVKKLLSRLNRNPVYVNGKCTEGDTTYQRPIPKQCNSDGILKAQVGCYAVPFLPKACSTLLKKKYPELARSFSSSLALSSFCKAQVKSVFAKKLLPNDVMMSALDIASNKGCQNNDGDVWGLGKKLLGCSMQASLWIHRVASAEYCANNAKHYCDDRYIRWLKHGKSRDQKNRRNVKNCTSLYET